MSCSDERECRRFWSSCFLPPHCPVPSFWLQPHKGNVPSSARSSLGRIVSQGGDPHPTQSQSAVGCVCLIDFVSLEFEPWLVEPKMKTSKSWFILMTTAQRSRALEISMFPCFTWALCPCCVSFLKLATVHLC